MTWYGATATHGYGRCGAITCAQRSVGVADVVGVVDEAAYRRTVHEVVLVDAAGALIGEGEYSGRGRIVRSGMNRSGPPESAMQLLPEPYLRSSHRELEPVTISVAHFLTPMLGVPYPMVVTLVLGPGTVSPSSRPTAEMAGGLLKTTMAMSFTNMAGT